MDYVVQEDARILWLGRQGENLARTMVFDISEWVAAFGAGSAAVIVRRSGGDSPYPATITRDGNTVRWAIQAADVAMPGFGVAELRYTVNSLIVKSKLYMTQTEASVGEAGDPPEPYESWVQEVLDAADDAEESATAAAASATAAASNVTMIAPEWSSGAIYQAGSWVRYNGNLYEATAYSEGGTAPGSSNSSWRLIKVTKAHSQLAGLIAPNAPLPALNVDYFRYGIDRSGNYTFLKRYVKRNGSTSISDTTVADELANLYKSLNAIGLDIENGQLVISPVMA